MGVGFNQIKSDRHEAISRSPADQVLEVGKAYNQRCPLIMRGSYQSLYLPPEPICLSAIQSKLIKTSYSVPSVPALSDSDPLSQAHFLAASAGWPRKARSEPFGSNPSTGGVRLRPAEWEVRSSDLICASCCAARENRPQCVRESSLGGVGLCCAVERMTRWSVTVNSLGITRDAKSIVHDGQN